MVICVVALACINPASASLERLAANHFSTLYTHQTNIDRELELSAHFNIFYFLLVQKLISFSNFLFPRKIHFIKIVLQCPHLQN